MNVNNRDYLAALVSTAMAVMDHLDIPEYFSRFSNRIFGDRWKFGLLVLKEFLDLSYEDLAKILPSLGASWRREALRASRTRTP